jgi:hypothetical protein
MLRGKSCSDVGDVTTDVTAVEVDKSLRASASTGPFKSGFGTTVLSQTPHRPIMGGPTRVSRNPKLLCRRNGTQDGSSSVLAKARQSGKTER